jgi:ribosomal protein S18 acetylase RimI-like enzyme
MRCRYATHADVAILNRFHRELDAHVLRANPRLWSGWLEDDYYQKMVESDDVRILVAENDAEIIGYMMGSVKQRRACPRRTGVINHAYVEPDHRRHGAGTALVLALLEFFDSRGVEDISLHYAEGNSDGRRFWSSLGFEPVSHTANATPAAVRGALVHTAG